MQDFLVVTYFSRWDLLASSKEVCHSSWLVLAQIALTLLGGTALKWGLHAACYKLLNGDTGMPCLWSWGRENSLENWHKYTSAMLD